MIHIVGPDLNQWDEGRLVCISNIDADCVYLSNKGDSRAVIMDIEEGQAKIPDYLLISGKQLCVSAVKNRITVEHETFFVRHQPRPENYIYEDDQRNYIYAVVDAVEATVSRAEKAAEAMEAALQKQPLKIQLFGDSMTDESWRALPGWPSYLAENLPTKELTVVNSAVGGNTLTRYQRTETIGETITVAPTNYSGAYLAYSGGVPKLYNIGNAAYWVDAYPVEAGVTYRIRGENIGLTMADTYPMMMFTEAETLVLGVTTGVDVVSDDGSYSAYGQVKGPVSVDFEYTPASNGWLLVFRVSAYAGELSVASGEEISTTYYKGVAWQMGLEEPTVGMYGESTKVYDPLAADADLVIVWAGANDWAGTTYELGSLRDGSMTTIYGATQRIIEAVSATNSKLLMITPLQRLNETDKARPENELGQKVNGKGYSLEQFVNAIAETCAYYAVPCLDMYHASGINTLNIDRYTTDGLHSNEAGAKLMAELIAGAIQNGVVGSGGSYGYSKAQVDAALGAYITDVAALVGGDA